MKECYLDSSYKTNPNNNSCNIPVSLKNTRCDLLISFNYMF